MRDGLFDALTLVLVMPPKTSGASFTLRVWGDSVLSDLARLIPSLRKGSEVVIVAATSKEEWVYKCT